MPALPLRQAALSVFKTASPKAKPAQAMQVYTQWKNGNIIYDPKEHIDWPDRPARPEQPRLLLPRNMPKRNKGGRNADIALLHAIAHIEFNAIDLAFDLIGRFTPLIPNHDFIADWMKIGQEEAKHFTLINNRLKQFGSFYGALPAHDGLWDAALRTKQDILARLAIIPLVLEARGLDVTPTMIKRFQGANDNETARILNIIYQDEKTHVAAGMKWFEHFCMQKQQDTADSFALLVKKYFKPGLKPPFNKKARIDANMPEAFFMPFTGNK